MLYYNKNKTYSQKCNFNILKLWQYDYKSFLVLVKKGNMFINQRRLTEKEESPKYIYVSAPSYRKKRTSQVYFCVSAILRKKGELPKYISVSAPSNREKKNFQSIFLSQRHLTENRRASSIYQAQIVLTQNS